LTENDFGVGFVEYSKAGMWTILNQSQFTSRDFFWKGNLIEDRDLM